MTWVKLDDGFVDHPKMERVGALAGWLHVAALCYCARHLTDGRIPKSKARRLVDIPQVSRHIDRLVSENVWHDDGDDYVLHDYLDYQPSRSVVEGERAEARARMAENRAKKKRSPEQSPNGIRSSEEVRLTGSSGYPVPSRPLQASSSCEQREETADPGPFDELAAIRGQAG